MQLKQIFILVTATVMLSGCAMASPIAIYEIDKARDAKYKAQQEQIRIQNQAIQQERLEKLKKEEGRKLNTVLSGFVGAITNGDLVQAQRFCMDQGIYQSLTSLKDTNLISEYYTDLCTEMMAGQPDIDGYTAILPFKASLTPQKDKDYLKSYEFTSQVEQAKYTQGIWDQDGIAELTKQMKSDYLVKVQKEQIDGKITFRQKNEQWLIERITDANGVDLIPSV